MVAAAAAGVSWDAAARWAAGLAPELSEKLAEVGLIPLRQERAGAALGTFLDAYLTR